MNLKRNSNSKIASCSIYLDKMSEPMLNGIGSGIYIGKTRIYKTPFFLDLNNTINRNIAVLGMSGSGKSYFMKSFIIRSNLERSSSVLIIDWNNEYSDVVKFLGGRTLTLGLDMKINVFEIYDLSNTRNIRNISELISYSLNLNSKESYAIYNKIISTVGDKSTPAMNISSLIKIFRKEKSALSKKLANKLLQLKHNPMFADKTDFQLNLMLEGVTSIDFSMLKDDTERSETSRSILRIVVELMHSMGINRASKNNERIIVLDETWRLIKNSEDIGILFREGRKYGFCVAVATQLVNDINNEILSNAATIFLFRLQSENDYKLLVDSGVINENDKQKLTQLSVGSCMISIVLKENSGVISKFFLQRTDGINVQTYVIKSGLMKRIVSYRVFSESIEKLLVSNEAKTKIAYFVASSNNELEDTTLLKFLINLKIGRPEIVYCLRSLGLTDMEIANSYANAADSK